MMHLTVPGGIAEHFARSEQGRQREGVLAVPSASKVCTQRRHAGKVEARKGQGATRNPRGDDNLSKASHKVFEDPEEWDSFVQSRTGLTSPAESDAAAAGNQEPGEQLGSELVQQEAEEAHSQSRRRTEQLLGKSAASALGERDTPVIPDLPEIAEKGPAAAPKPAPIYVRDDFWDDKPKPPPQPVTLPPAPPQPKASAAAAAPAKQGSQSADEGAQAWWQQLEQEFDALDDEDDLSDEAPARIEGPPDFVVIREGADPVGQPVAQPSITRTPQTTSRADQDEPATASAPQPGVSSPIPAVAPVGSKRQQKAGQPLPAIARLARSTPPPQQPQSASSQQQEQPQSGPSQQWQPTADALQQQQQLPQQLPRVIFTQPVPSPNESQQQQRQLLPSVPSTSQPAQSRSPPADPPASKPAEPTISTTARSGRRLDVPFDWDPPAESEPVAPLSPPPSQSGVDPLSRLRDSASQLQQLEQKVAQQKLAQQGDRKPWQFSQGANSDLDFFSREGFPDVGAANELMSGLKGMGIKSPSHIQAAAFQPVLAGKKDLVIADHAGSGKTLAYLAPLAQSLMEEERMLKPAPAPKAPRVLVITPTAELSAQVLQVARSLAKGIPFRSFPITGGYRFRTQRQALEQGVDMVVGTPGRLWEHLQGGSLDLSACHTAVLDEADVLLGDAAAFAEQVEPLRRALPPTARLLLVTATMPEPIWLQVQAKFPEVQTCLGPRLHRSAPGVAERVFDCSGGEEINEETGFLRKADRLVQLMREQQSPRTIIFCNKIETCRKVENHLKRHAQAQQQARSAAHPLTVLPYHAAIEAKLRPENLQAFMAPPGTAPMALVCTDRASRGIDSAACSHVVLFDLPRDPSEYVRRAGRTSRGTSSGGNVSLLVLGRQVKVARQIVARNQRQLPIHRLPELPD